MTHEKLIPPPAGYPFFGWTKERIREYIESKPLAEGDLMIIYNGQGGYHRYVLASVVNPSSGIQRRVILTKAGDAGGTSFYRTGKNTFHSAGKSQMLPPVPELMLHLTLDQGAALKLPPYAAET